MEKRKKISLWLLLLSLAQTPLATAAVDAHSSKKKVHTHHTSKKVEKKSTKKSKKKNHSVVSKTAHKHKPHADKPTSIATTRESHVFESGKACIYSTNLHGSATASGERFNKNAMTAAHLHLPLGSHVRVTSVETGKSVVVRINDRGPYAKKFVLDMSPAAAQKIGLSAAKGTMTIKIHKLGKDKKALAEEEASLAAE